MKHGSFSFGLGVFFPLAFLLRVFFESMNGLLARNWEKTAAAASEARRLKSVHLFKVAVNS